MVKCFSLMTLALLSTASLVARAANCDNGICLPQPPDMPAYMAYEVKPPLRERVQNNLYFLQGWYITGGINISFMQLTSIDNDQNVFANATTAKNSASQTRVGPAVAIGYDIRPKGGFLSRAEIAYYYRPNFEYNANPFLITDPAQPANANSITSDIDNHTILLKIYNDFNFGSPFIPYIQAGVGVAFNSISANSNLGVIGTTPFVGSASRTRALVAADGGLGARLKLNPNFFFDAGYEFEYLGHNLQYNLNYTNPLTPGFVQQVKLTTGIFYSNSILIGLTWQPMPKEVPANS